MVDETRKESIAMDGNRLLKAFALSIEDKMAAEAFGHARNYG